MTDKKDEDVEINTGFQFVFGMCLIALSGYLLWGRTGGAVGIACIGFGYIINSYFIYRMHKHEKSLKALKEKFKTIADPEFTYDPIGRDKK